MAYRNLAKVSNRFLGPTAPRKRHPAQQLSTLREDKFSAPHQRIHPLTDIETNQYLQKYELEIKGKFDEIVPLLKSVSALQHEHDFVSRAKELTHKELGFDLPDHILNKAWVRPLDMRGLFAWCVFQAHQQTSDQFFELDPLQGGVESRKARDFQSFLEGCGFHLLDITPCSDGRLAHTIAYALRIPFSAVRRRSHAGALFDIEKTVNRWIKTEHRRFLEGLPNKVEVGSRYLKVVTYHFSSLNPTHQGCAAHGSNDALAASEGYNRLLGFREAVEKSFCCGASVDLLLIGLDTDTDAIRVHVPSSKGEIDLAKWVCAVDVYEKTKALSTEVALNKILEIVEENSPNKTEPGMATFIARLIANNISQIDYVRELHGGNYPDAGHAERFIGVGIGFKEVHLRNLTYFSHLDTVEQGAPDLDVGVKIFKGLNVSRDLPIPVVVRFDYSGDIQGARERAIADCRRVNDAIGTRYRDLVADGLLHTFLTIRDRDKKTSAEVVGSSLDPAIQEGH